MRLAKIIICLCIIQFPLIAQETIHINSTDGFLKLLRDKVTLYDSIDLHISNIDFSEDYEDSIYLPFKNWKNLSSVRSVVLKDLEDISEEELSSFLKQIPENQLNSLKLINLQIDEEFSLQNIGGYKNLKTLSVLGTKLGKSFFINFDTNNFPKLKNLELISCDLKYSFLSPIRKSELMSQLEFLDLSMNELGNSVFSIFPQEESGKLRTLKLNRCNIVLDSDDKYLAVTKQLKDLKRAVNWQSPYFENLTHLEIENETDEMDEIKEYLAEEKFQNLQIFLGFLPTFEDDYSQAEKNQRWTDFIKIATSYPIESVRNNYTFTSIGVLNIFLKSRQAKVTENINLKGKRWNYVAVKTLLKQNHLPALKEIFLFETGMKQKDISNLINEFKTISFDAVLEKPGSIWPRIAEDK